MEVLGNEHVLCLSPLAYFSEPGDGMRKPSPASSATLLGELTLPASRTGRLTNARNRSFPAANSHLDPAFCLGQLSCLLFSWLSFWKPISLPSQPSVPSVLPLWGPPQLPKDDAFGKITRNPSAQSSGLFSPTLFPRQSKHPALDGSQGVLPSGKACPSCQEKDEEELTRGGERKEAAQWGATSRRPPWQEVGWHACGTWRSWNSAWGSEDLMGRGLL